MYILHMSVWVYNICISSKKISRGGGRFLSRDQRIEAGGVGNGQVNSATFLYSFLDFFFFFYLSSTFFSRPKS